MKLYKSTSFTPRECLQLVQQLTDDPTNARVWRDFGSLCWQLKKRKEAKKCWEKSRALDPSDPWTHLFLANHYLADRELKSALDAAHQAQDRRPSEGYGYILAAQAYAKMRRLAKAEHELKKGLLAAPHDPKVKKEWDRSQKWRERRKRNKFAKQSKKTEAICK